MSADEDDLAFAAVIAKIDAASARVDAIYAPCPTCGHIPQSWRQPRVPRSVTQAPMPTPAISAFIRAMTTMTPYWDDWPMPDTPPRATETAQERPSTESAHESPLETGETA